MVKKNRISYNWKIFLIIFKYTYKKISTKVKKNIFFMVDFLLSWSLTYQCIYAISL